MLERYEIPITINIKHGERSWVETATVTVDIHPDGTKTAKVPTINIVIGEASTKE